MTISLNKQSFSTSKYFWTFIISAVSVFVMVFAGHVFAVDSSSSAQETTRKYGITFPIAELGNCASLAECKAYCDDPSHIDTCIAFAKKKGFYKETNNNANAYLRAAAKAELGCDGPEECRSFCQLEENHDKCFEFAKKHSLGGPKPLSATAAGGLSAIQILEKAQEILGCDSISSCKAFCQKTENQQKCSDFAHQVGLAGGIHKSPANLGRLGGYPSSGSSLPATINNPSEFCRQFPDKCRQYGTNPPNFSPSPKPPFSPLPPQPLGAPQATSGFNQ